VSDTAQSRVRAARRFLRLVAGWHEVAWYLGWTRNLLSKALLRIRKRSKSALKLKQQLKLCVCVGAREHTHMEHTAADYRTGLSGACLSQHGLLLQQRAQEQEP